MTAASNIIDAFTHGGPLVSCWNVEGGWNLRQQVEWIRGGRRYMPAVFVPLLHVAANKQRAWDRWYPENREALAFINEHRLPVTMRWHNWLNEFTEAENRGWPEHSPLVWRKLASGALDSSPVIDPLGPLAAWESLGEQIAMSLWLKNLANELRNCPSFYLVENNETPTHSAGHYTRKLTARDAYGEQLREWLPNLESINVRAPAFVSEHPDANQCGLHFARLYTEKYERLNDALLDNLPEPMQGKSYTGAYGGAAHTELKYDYANPRNDWANAPWSHALRRWGETSERVYDDASGGDSVRRNWVRSPQTCLMNLAPINRYLSERRQLWHNDFSLWISPKRGADLASGLVTPQVMKGFARFCLWAAKCDKRATVARRFAESADTLEGSFYGSFMPEADYTNGEMFEAVMDAADEVWENATLLNFYRDGDPVLNVDPPLCEWKLPASIIDDRSRLLYTDADESRYADVSGKQVDRWRKSGGEMELKVFAQAWRLESLWLVFAWSPKQSRLNITVTVPGYGAVKFPRVDQDGMFQLVGEID